MPRQTRDSKEPLGSDSAAGRYENEVSGFI